MILHFNSEEDLNCFKRKMTIRTPATTKNDNDHCNKDNVIIINEKPQSKLPHPLHNGIIILSPLELLVILNVNQKQNYLPIEISVNYQNDPIKRFFLLRI